MMRNNNKNKVKKNLELIEAPRMSIRSFMERLYMDMECTASVNDEERVSLDLYEDIALSVITEWQCILIDYPEGPEQFIKEGNALGSYQFPDFWRLGVKELFLEFEHYGRIPETGVPYLRCNRNLYIFWTGSKYEVFSGTLQSFKNYVGNKKMVPKKEQVQTVIPNPNYYNTVFHYVGSLPSIVSTIRKNTGEIFERCITNESLFEEVVGFIFNNFKWKDYKLGNPNNSPSMSWLYNCRDRLETAIVSSAKSNRKSLVWDRVEVRRHGITKKGVEYLELETSELFGRARIVMYMYVDPTERLGIFIPIKGNWLIPGNESKYVNFLLEDEESKNYISQTLGTSIDKIQFFEDDIVPVPAYSTCLGEFENAIIKSI